MAIGQKRSGARQFAERLAELYRGYAGVTKMTAAIKVRETSIERRELCDCRDIAGSVLVNLTNGGARNAVKQIVDRIQAKIDAL